MAVDPNISLAAKAPDVMGTLGQFANIQNTMNQNRLFQQTFAARQMAGKIIASAPDLETGLGMLPHNPLTAAFAGEITNTFRQLQSTIADINLKTAETAGKVQEQTDNGLKGFFRNLAPIMARPTYEGWNSIKQATLQGLSGPAKRNLESAIDWAKKGLLDGIPNDPNDPLNDKRRSQVFNQGMIGALLAGGHTPASIDAVAGTNEWGEFGGYKVPLKRMPAAAGGEISQVGAPIQMTAPAGNVQGPFGSGGAPTMTQVPGGMPAGAQGPSAGGLGQSAPAVAAPPSAGLVGQSVAQTALQEGQAKDFVDYTKNLNARVLGGGQLMTRINEVIPLLEQARTGGGTTWRTRLAEIGQAIGLDDKYVKGIQGGSLPAAQELEKYLVRTAADQMKQSIATGNTSNFELETFLKSNPNLDTDPRASRKILEYMSKMYRIDKAEQDALVKAQKAKDFEPREWPNKWQNEALARGLWDDKLPKAPKGSKTVDKSSERNPDNIAGKPRDIPMARAKETEPGKFEMRIKPMSAYKSKEEIKEAHAKGEIGDAFAIEALKRFGLKSGAK